MVKQAGLYLHIPFCKSKCPYCRFYSIKEEPQVKEAFIAAILQEWKQRKKLLKGYKLTSVYLGGGNPLCLGTDRIADLLAAITPGNCEITIEANPGDINSKTARELKTAGVNRISLGAQSFNDGELKKLGRDHSAKESFSAIELLEKSGFDNISIDLMYELPGQTFSSWQKTLEQIKNLPISHLSLYNLEILPGTAFYKKRKSLGLPSEKEGLQLLEMGIHAIEEMGLERYELSAFSKKGCRSRHNIGYWTGRPFLGLGPSAFSYWNSGRFSNAANLKTYCEKLKQKKLPVNFMEKLPYPQNLQELLVINLRLVEGVDLKEFQEKQGLLPKEIWQKLQKSPLVKLEKKRCRLTKKGLLFYDTLAAELI